MNKEEARIIGNQFLRTTKQDVNSYDGKLNKLGAIIDYNIFYEFTIVTADGDGFIGGYAGLIDKRTKFCLLIGASPNALEFQIHLFRVIILKKLYDFEIPYEEFKKKKEDIKFEDYLESIFILIDSYPKNQNIFLEFLDILILLEEETINDNSLEKFYYKSIFSNSYTLESFFRGYQHLSTMETVKSKLEKLEQLLSEKGNSISILQKKYINLLQEREDYQEEIRQIEKMEKEEKENKN